MNIRKFNNKPNIVLIQGSPRSVDNCPNENSKTSALVQHIYQKYEHIANFEIIDLSLQQNKNIIKPCKACISTAGGFHCSYPCSCYSKETEDLMYDLDVYSKLQNCDAFLVFSPIHWYSVTSQVKAMFDRLVCINLTMTTDDAKEFYGDNMKNREYTAYAEQSGKYDHLLKNHLEGKICGFFAHGDNGGVDYNNMEKPESLKNRMMKEKHFSENPESFLMPFVYQMRYSGVVVPDELIKAVYINTKVDYATSNDIFSYDYIAHHEAELLFQKLMNIL